MHSTIDVVTGDYTLAELATLLSVEPPDAARLLDDHGYPAIAGEERLPLTEEDYAELMVTPSLAADDVW